MDFNPEKIKLIIGLGNPGEKYADTYHNVGFLFINYLNSRKPLISNFQITNHKLIKSDVYMNESGAFVKKILKERRAEPKELLVVHDDSDIAIGKCKFSFGRGAAGHKGVESVIRHLRTKNFWRLRIGIRPAQERRRRKSGLSADLSAKVSTTAGARRAMAGDFVLKKISKKDRALLEKFFEETLSYFRGQKLTENQGLRA